MKTFPKDGKIKKRAGKPLKRKIHLDEVWTWQFKGDKVAIRTPDFKFTYFVSVWCLTGINPEDWYYEDEFPSSIDQPYLPPVQPKDVRQYIVETLMVPYNSGKTKPSRRSKKK